MTIENIKYYCFLFFFFFCGEGAGQIRLLRTGISGGDGRVRLEHNQCSGGSVLVCKGTGVDSCVFVCRCVWL